MKNLILFGIVFAAYTATAQSELVDYKIAFDKDIVDCAVYAYAADNPQEQVGAIESIKDSKISLRLSPERDYRVIVNNMDIIDITQSDIALKQKEDVYRENLSNKEGLFFTVQIGAFTNTFPEELMAQFPELFVDDSSSKEFRRYMLGSHNSPDDVLRALEELKAGGFPDAFPVAYQNGERIQYTKALQLADHASK